MLTPVLADVTVRTSNLAITLVEMDLNFQGISDTFYLEVETMNKNG
jgi:hypothetical protein